MPQIKPVVLAMVVCERIYDDPKKQAVLSGVLWSVPAEPRPYKFDSLWAYIAMTGVHGTIEPDLRVTEGERQLQFGVLRQTARSPLDFHELRVDLSGSTLTGSEEVYFDLTLEGEPLASRRLAVERPKPQAPSP